MWLDVALKGIGLASTIIATLRAGSRAVFLVDRDAIGILEGPTITRPNASESDNDDGGTSLFELSEAFRHCVRLSFAPHLYENVKLRQPVSTVVEPYPLSTRPYIDPKQEDRKEDEHRNDESHSGMHSETEMLNTANSTLNSSTPTIVNTTLSEYNGTATNESEAVYATNQRASFYNRLAFAINPFNGARILLSSIPPTIQQSQKYLVVAPSVASYYAKKVVSMKEKEGRKENKDLGKSLLTLMLLG